MRILRDHFLALPYLLLPLLLSCSKSGGFDGADENRDNTPPVVISDLTITTITPHSISLRWSVAGDDGDSGTAARYDLRFLPQEITSDNWDSAVQAEGLPVPSESEEFDSVTVAGLLEDSTYYFAIKAADSDNNWSGLSNVVTAVCFNDFAVNFPDTALQRIIQFYTAKPGDDILRSDLLPFEYLNVPNQRIQDLTGIEYCVNLAWLNLWNNRITDLSPIQHLSKIRVLYAGANGLANLDPLASLAELDTLHLNANAITDISALAPLDNLSELVLTANSISDLSPLDAKTTIHNLLLDQNQIVFTNPLYSLTGIDRLNLSGNLIDDLLPIVNNTGLGTGDTLWLTGNPLAAATTDSLISVLQNRGITVIR